MTDTDLYIKKLEEQNEHFQQRLSTYESSYCHVFKNLENKNYDIDFVMFIACFEMFETFVIKELNGHFNIINVEEYKVTLKENNYSDDDVKGLIEVAEKDNVGWTTIKELYEWWESYKKDKTIADTVCDEKLKSLMEYRTWLWT